MRIRFFIDQCVPDSVGRVLTSLGHEVVLLREKLPPNSPDALVASISEQNNAVLISMDSDFRKLAPRIPLGKRRFRKLSRIGLKCAEPKAARRLEDALSLFEHEWERAQAQSDRRVIVEVGETYIRTIR